MPGQIGYVGNAPYQPVNYQKGGYVRSYAPNQGAGKPAKARSNQIRQAIRKRGKLHGVALMAQRVPSGPQGVRSSRAADRGQPPMTNTNVIHGLTNQALPPTRVSNQRNQGGRGSGPFPGSNSPRANKQGVTRPKRRVSRGVSY